MMQCCESVTEVRMHLHLHHLHGDTDGAKPNCHDIESYTRLGAEPGVQTCWWRLHVGKRRVTKDRTSEMLEK